MHSLQIGLHLVAGSLQGELGQVSHDLGDVIQRGPCVAVQAHQALKDQLAGGAQGRAGVKPLCP